MKWRGRLGELENIARSDKISAPLPGAAICCLGMSARKKQCACIVTGLAFFLTTFFLISQVAEVGIGVVKACHIHSVVFTGALLPEEMCGRWWCRCWLWDLGVMVSCTTSIVSNSGV